jgi:hypothetical protein
VPENPLVAGEYEMRLSGIARRVACALVLVLSVFAQSPNGNINGSVQDPSNGAIVAAEIVAVNDVTGVQYTTKTNSEGIFVLPNLPPGPYRVQVSKIGFKTIIKPDIVLNVQDALSLNFTLPVGAAYEVLTVEGGAPLVNTENATVSTVIDRQFAENLPMNGRSFQTLIELTPGVVVTATNYEDNGQFSVNGQRAASNYWMVDGVSANIGIGPVFGGGNGIGGAVGSFSALGGTNSIVSVDALQEFRIQTSTFAPEFGRTPGGQISIVTRSGTNRFHGTAFDYLRNDVFDAKNWFNGYTNNPPLPKSKERQNDFGGTFNGPIGKDKTFFFFSYEGLRLRLPQTSLTTVPDLASRQNAHVSVRPLLDAYPLPNGPDDPSTGVAQFNASYSNPASLDAYSLRVDHRLNQRWTVFGRYNYSPSEFADRGGTGGNSALSNLQWSRITTHTATAAGTWTISHTMTNDLRFNYSHVNANGFDSLDSFGGAVPLSAPPFPASFTEQNAQFGLGIFSLKGEGIILGKQAQDIQRQINVVDGFSWQKGLHSLKFGVDYRHLAPIFRPVNYDQAVIFTDVPSAEMGNAAFSEITSRDNVNLGFNNLGAYAQDTWHALPRLTLTYGLRWDVDYKPSSTPNIPAVTGYSQTNFANLNFASLGRPAFATRFANLAPRIGFAYEVGPAAGWQTVVRGGFGVFYDLVSSEVGNVLNSLSFEPPFGNQMFYSNAPYPLTAAQSAPIPIPTSASFAQSFFVFNPNLKLPYTLEWNGALQQALGKGETLSASYVGASGKRLLQTTTILGPQPTFPGATFPGGSFVDNTADSKYNALQLQYQRRLSRGLQAIASYSWSHSIDNASAGSYGNGSNLGAPGNVNKNRGDSDFDIRNALSGALTYDIPTPTKNALVKAVLGGWSCENLLLVRSAPPIDVSDVNFFQLNGGLQVNIRPDIVPGEPAYLYGRQYPGGKALNPSAFASPPVDPSTGNPIRQGDLSRNWLRGFGAVQWDFALHRQIPIHESVKLEFRVEMFNVMNHPNFGPPSTSFGLAGFGLATTTLAQSLSGSGSGGAGGFNPLYQIGGPRSMQFALKAIF